MWFPEAMHGTLLGAVDVLRAAVCVARMQNAAVPLQLNWRFITPEGKRIALPGMGGASGMRWKPDAARTLLIVPGLHTLNAPQIAEIARAYPAALQMVGQHAAAGGWIAACANGIVFPALAGLLDGARLAAPWASQGWFSRTFPRCDFFADAPMSQHNRVFSCTAVSLQTEFMLYVLGELLSADLAQACASLLLHQPERQQITPELISNKWLPKTSDSPVYRAMQWLQTHIDTPFQMSQLAEAAAVSERTLLRHFRQVLGRTPLDYLHELRVERAKVLLEVTLQDAKSIAQACGYQDAASFRRLFQRATGLSPSEHRARFALRSPKRKHWRVPGTTV
ncbi:GlxA family transcriptional regulator [Massilia putida]|uniref:GlxA family transcriptional regulator n=1 Tax=Massilia putida TaxID=1141883 RepID=UPI001E3A63B0|nr:helix-turn-helix domain-containing protein [Massilia putida]